VANIRAFAKCKLKAIDIASGTVEVLADALGGRGGAWNNQGTIPFAPEIFGPLPTISERGGVATRATKISRLGGGQTHRWPSFLPDDKHFLFTLDWSSPDDSLQNGMYVGSLDSPDTKLISSELSGNVYFVSGYLLYVQERSLMAQPFDTGKLQSARSKNALLLLFRASADRAYRPQRMIFAYPLLR
jgi:eukaryotic-like serine/threonine-protein kinase